MIVRLFNNFVIVSDGHGKSVTLTCATVADAASLANTLRAKGVSFSVSQE